MNKKIFHLEYKEPISINLLKTTSIRMIFFVGNLPFAVWGLFKMRPTLHDLQTCIVSKIKHNFCNNFCRL